MGSERMGVDLDSVCTRHYYKTGNYYVNADAISTKNQALPSESVSSLGIMGETKGPPETPRTLSPYCTVEFKGTSELSPHYAERRGPLVQRMQCFPNLEAACSIFPGRAIVPSDAMHRQTGYFFDRPFERLSCICILAWRPS